MERWDGQRGFGPLNARHAMARAVELAHQFGIGMVALGNNNHWMRGGTYGWQAADAGCIGICWSNTCPNMPAWGARCAAPAWASTAAAKRTWSLASPWPRKSGPKCWRCKPPLPGKYADKNGLPHKKHAAVRLFYL